MPLYEPYLPARYVSPLLDIVAAQRASFVNQILQQVGLTQAQLRASDALLTSPEFDALMVAMATELGRDDLGFELGLRITIDDHQALGVVLRRCKTFDEILRTFARYWRQITTGFVFRYQRFSDRGELIFRPAMGMSQSTLYAFEELQAVSFHTDFTSLMGARAGLKIQLSMPEPKHIARYARLRPTRFYFGAESLPQVRCIIPADLLDMQLTQPAPKKAAGSLTITQSAIRTNQPNKQHSDWVSLVLREAEGVQPTLESLAELLNVSPRTLNRYLGREGTNLRALGNVIRFQRATQMLAQTQQPITQIAYRLGYADPISFCTAFRKIGGLSPRAFRKAA
jgi:AraC-like DNA-binding protein